MKLTDILDVGNDWACDIFCSCVCNYRGLGLICLISTDRWQEFQDRDILIKANLTEVVEAAI